MFAKQHKQQIKAVLFSPDEWMIELLGQNPVAV